MVRELLEIQDRSYRSTFQLLLTDMKEDVKSLKKDIDELKHSLQFSQKDIKDLQDKTLAIEKKIGKCSKTVNQHDEDLEDVSNQIEYLENQSRRNNLKITGVEESEEEKTWEDTEEVVKKIIREKLKIEEDIQIERAHRIGKPRPANATIRHDWPKVKPRHIVAKLTSWKQKETILKTARRKRPEGVIFYPDYTKRTLEKRADRIPEMLNARKQGKTAFFIMDKLIIKDRGRPPDFDARDETGHSDDEDNEVFINRR